MSSYVAKFPTKWDPRVCGALFESRTPTAVSCGGSGDPSRRPGLPEDIRDHSVCVEMVRRRHVRRGGRHSPTVTAPCSSRPATLLHRQKPTASPMALVLRGWTPEKAAGEFFDVGEYAVPLKVMQTMGDKFCGLDPTPAAWNAGRVLVPSSAPWLEEFTRTLKLHGRR